MQAYTVEQVAEMLHIGRDKVYCLLRTGQLRSMKIGKLRRSPTGTWPSSSPRSKPRPATATATTTSARRGRRNPGTHNKGRKTADENDHREVRGHHLPGRGRLHRRDQLRFDAAGKRQRVKRKGRTKAQVKDKLREVMEDLEAGVTGLRATPSPTPSVTSWTRA